MDGGKPLRESRDVDIPLAAAHFFHYAGWADKLRYGVTAREVRPLGVVGQIVPWNFPLLMAAWKLAPALACGNVGDPEAGRDDAADRAAARRDLPGGRAAAGRGRDPPGRRRRPARRSCARRTSTRSRSPARPPSAATSRPRWPGTDTRLTLELGGKSANIVFEDAALDQAVEGIVNGIFFNQGHVCCAGSRLLIQESVHDEVIASCGSGWAVCASATRWTRTPTSARSTPPSSSSGSRRSSPPARTRARTRRTIDCELPERGYWFAPTLFTDVSPAHRIAVEEIFGPVVSVLTFRTQAEAIEKANNSRYGLAAGIWTDKGSKAFEVASALKAGVVWQNTYNHFDPTRGVRRLQGVGVRARGRPGRSSPLSADRAMTRLSVRKTYKLWIGGAFVRSESGRYDEADGVQLPAGVAQGRPRRGRRRAQGVPDRGRLARHTTAGRSCTGPPRRSSRARGTIGVPREEVDAAVDVLLHYAGWTDKLHAVLGGVNPVAAPFLSFSLPEPTGVVGVVAPDAPPLLGLVAELAPALAAGNVLVAILSESQPLPGLDLAEALGVSDVPRGVVNLLSGRRGELAKALGGHRDLNAIVDAAGDAELSAELDRLAAETIKRVRHGAAATSYEDADRRCARAARGGHRAQDRLAPGRRLTHLHGLSFDAPRRDRGIRCLPHMRLLTPPRDGASVGSLCRSGGPAEPGAVFGDRHDAEQVAGGIDRGHAQRVGSRRELVADVR